MAKEEALYIRNGRPNMVVFSFNGVRYKLHHRGNRADSISLPVDAKNDPVISRWLQKGQLEKISKESFMKLGARQVDILPNQYLKREMRKHRGAEVRMRPADADTTKSLTQLDEKDVHKEIQEKAKLEWAGDLMSTDEELETFDYTDDSLNYPSKHRDDDARQQMGY